MIEEIVRKLNGKKQGMENFGRENKIFFFLKADVVFCYDVATKILTC